MISKNNKILFYMISQESLAMDTFKDVNILVKFFQNLLDPTLLILKKKKIFSN